MRRGLLVLTILSMTESMQPQQGSVERELKERVRKLEKRNKELEALITSGEIKLPEEELGIVPLALKRLTSLMFFLACLSATAIILESWADTLSKEVELSFFIPLMIGHGGNTGGSVVGSTIAELAAKGKVSYVSTLCREVACASLVGAILAALANFVLPFVGISRHTTTVVTCTIFSVTILSTIVGATLPFALKALNLDAAAYGPPAVTTLIDAMGLITYLVIADTILKHLYPHKLS